MLEKIVHPLQQTAAITIETPLQNSFLQALCREQVPVHVYLINGIKLQGRIQTFDSHTILLKNGASQLVYKCAVSTICPAENVTIGIN